jgi:probable rRNA maturation factor
MKKLVLECLEKKIKLKKLCKAVYTVLEQVENLKAELVFIEAEEMQGLNRETRGVDKTTDVLSYPSMDGIRGKVLRKEDCPTELDGKYIFLGSIVLCLDKIREQAIELGHTEEEERDYLIIHGLMHLFGYDHMNATDKKQMREKEKAVISLLEAKKK